MRLLPILIATGFASPAFAQKLSERFTVSDTCSGKNMDSIMQETINLADAAIKAIEALSAGGLTYKSTPKNFLAAASTAFGVEAPGMFAFSLKDEDKTRLGSAKGNFQKVKDALAAGKNIDTKDNYFFCDSTDLEWETKIHNVLPSLSSDKDKSVKDFFTENGASRSPDGIWRDKEHKQANGDSNWVTDEYGDKTICGDHAAEGITYARNTPKNMFLCPKAFDNYQGSISSQKDTTDEVDWDDVKSMPGVLLHEMLHWVDGNIVDESVTLPQGTGKAYGLPLVWALAENNKGFGDKSKCLTNADSYHVFATMVYMEKAQF